VLYQFQDIDSKKLEPFLTNDFIHIRKETEIAYFEKFVINVVKKFKVRATGFDIEVVRSEPEPVLSLENDIRGLPVLLLKYKYGQRSILPSNGERVFVDMRRDGDNVRFVKTIRQPEAEAEIVEMLKNKQLQTTNGVYFYPDGTEGMAPEDAVLEFVSKISQMSDSLLEAGITVRQEIGDKRYHFGKIDLQIAVRQKNDWFDLHGQVTIGNFTIPFVKLYRNIIRNNREYELPDGTIAVLPAEWFTRYSELFHSGQIVNDSLVVGKQMFGLLHEAGFSTPEVEKMRHLFESGNMPKATLPAGLNATLRSYQMTGYYWLKLLKSNGFGGCLADDMGLGKTLQALALLLDASTDKIEMQQPATEQFTQLSLFDQPQIQTVTKRPTSLIVVPLSLIHNWAGEAAKFAPSLKVLAHIGNNRTRTIATFDYYDVVITTYGLVRNDNDLLSAYNFHYIILDESQAIKNSSSKSYTAVTNLRSRYRLVLTGTPVENSLTDLWSQMNFVNPGLLGSFQRFKNEYVTSIESDPECQRAAQLRALVEPFILRRTKSEVASDLPPKTEQIRSCAMDSEQQALYEKEKSAMRNALITKINSDGAAKTSALVLQSLMRLRQIACHPKLVGFGEPSAKFDEVTRVLDTVLSENHKVLMFSSFVKYLNIYEEYLRQKNIPYVVLTGETADREAVIRRFQTDGRVQVFLISLKAGGVGINLTSADYVFVLDPWWNPSAENQAVDRAHRIGQTRNVFVYKFVTAGTLEEKIIALQNRKSQLADIFANSNPFKNFTIDEMMELFD